MTDQYKYLETPEEAFKALREMDKGGPVVEFHFGDGAADWRPIQVPKEWRIASLEYAKFRVPLPAVVTVVYHVHEKISGCHLYERYTEEEAWDVVGEFCYIVKHTVTNGVPAVEVVK